MNPTYLFPHARLLIFAKAPVPGRVKTRLAGRWGCAARRELYKNLLRRTLGSLTPPGCVPVELWCAPDARHGFFVACRRDYAVRLRRQCAAIWAGG
jgi:hypothetical protein